MITLFECTAPGGASLGQIEDTSADAVRTRLRRTMLVEARVERVRDLGAEVAEIRACRDVVHARRGRLDYGLTDFDATIAAVDGWLAAPGPAHYRQVMEALGAVGLTETKRGRHVGSDHPDMHTLRMAGSLLRCCVAPLADAGAAERRHHILAK